MKKLICLLLACLLMLGGLCQAETSPVQATLITVVDGDGQKPWLLVLNYGTELAQGSVDIGDYVVENYEIEAVYTSDIPDVPEASVDGWEAAEEARGRGECAAHCAGVPAASVCDVPGGL